MKSLLNKEKQYLEASANRLCVLRGEDPEIWVSRGISNKDLALDELKDFILKLKALGCFDIERIEKQRGNYE